MRSATVFACNLRFAEHHVEVHYDWHEMIIKRWLLIVCQ